MVEDKEADRRLVRKGFAELLHDPSASGMARDVEVKDTPPIMADQKEDVKHVEGEGRD
jgi:hypothetical protein